MKNRCSDKADLLHKKSYFDRGIRVCNEWKNDFKAFYNWAINNGYSDELTIDRIDNNGNYSPDNCRWATVKEQNKNRRSNHLITFNGETHTMKEWSEILKIDYNKLKHRINNYNWPIEEAF